MADAPLAVSKYQIGWYHSSVFFEPLSAHERHNIGLILMQLEAVAFCNFQRPFARFLSGRKFADKAVDAFAGCIVL